MRVACIGECMVELSEQPDGTLARGFGGDTLNTALYLARLGVAVDYVTALGDDVWSDEMAAAWGREGIGLDRVRRLPGRMPGLYIIRTDADGERSFHYWRDRAAARDLFTEPGAAETGAALAAYDLVYLSGISLSLYGETGRAALFETLAALRARGGRVAFDTNYRPRGWPDREVARAAFRAALAQADLIFASVEDLDWLFGAAGADEVLCHRGRAEIVLKTSDGIRARRPGAARGIRRHRAGRAGGPGRRHDGRGRQLRGGLPRRAHRRAAAGGGRRRGPSPRRRGDRASRRRDSPGRDAGPAVRPPGPDA